MFSSVSVCYSHFEFEFSKNSRFADMIRFFLKRISLRFEYEPESARDFNIYADSNDIVLIPNSN